MGRILQTAFIQLILLADLLPLTPLSVIRKHQINNEISVDSIPESFSECWGRGEYRFKDYSPMLQSNSLPRSDESKFISNLWDAKS